MRGALLMLLAASCTPEIVSGAYYCGENASCPEGQVCSYVEGVVILQRELPPGYMCVDPDLAVPFSCGPDQADDTPETAYALPPLDCGSVPLSRDNCMQEGDPADWVKLVAPAGCTVAIDARVAFPVAFARLGLELWDLAANEKLATDSECTSGTAESGEDMRCLKAPLTPGASYGIQVVPTGDGDCDGACAYNPYNIGIRLVAPR